MLVILTALLLAYDTPPPDSGIGSYKSDDYGTVKVCCDESTGYYWPPSRRLQTPRRKMLEDRRRDDPRR